MGWTNFEERRRKLPQKNTKEHVKGKDVKEERARVVESSQGRHGKDRSTGRRGYVGAAKYQLKYTRAKVSTFL